MGDRLSTETEISPEGARRVLWELFELNFRFELLALDRRASGANTEPEVLARQELVLTCFPGNPGLSGSASLLTVDSNHAHLGLSAPSWQNRLPYIYALMEVMAGWEAKDMVEFHIPAGTPTEDEVLIVEDSIAKFYAQTFFDYFGRAALLPHRL
jgi:hypothetical protein